MTKVSAQTFARGYKKRIQLGKTLLRFSRFFNKKYFTLFLKTMILTALANPVIGTEVFKLPKQPPEVFLKFKLKFHKIHGKGPMPGSQNRVSKLLLKAWKLLSYKLQVTSSVKLKIGLLHITIKITHRKTSKISSRAYIFQRPF